MTQFERFATFAQMELFAIAYASKATCIVSFDYGIYSDNNGLTHRPQVIMYTAEQTIYLRWNAFASEDVDHIGKRSKLDANAMATAFAHHIRQRCAVVNTKRNRKAARKQMKRHYNTAAAMRSDAFYQMTRASYHISCLRLYVMGIVELDVSRERLALQIRDNLQFARHHAADAKHAGLRLP